MGMQTRSWMMTAALAMLSASFFFCGCQMKGSEKPDKTRQAAVVPSGQQDYQRGIGFYHKGLWADAISAYNEAVRLEPRNANFYAARGDTYNKMGNIPFAIVDYSKAIELAPRSAEFYYSRAKAYFSVNDYEKALADTDKAGALGLDAAEFRKKVMQAGKIFGANEFVLSGILVDKTQGYLAIINDEIAGIGSVVNGARVMEITQYHVRLERNGEVITKTIPSSDVTQQPASAAK
jgi:tetratricopeptide (TPR) repeat protein